jgi:hypothetical protein
MLYTQNYHLNSGLKIEANKFKIDSIREEVRGGDFFFLQN